MEKGSKKIKFPIIPQTMGKENEVLNKIHFFK